MPLFEVGIEVVADPKIVHDWPFPGWDGGDVGHTWLISACNSHSAPFFTALKQFWKSLPLRRRMSDTQLISWPQPLVSTYNFP